MASFWYDQEPLILEMRARSRRLLGNGQWHHLAFTWSSGGGRYQLLLDGNMVAEGDDYGEGRYLPEL